MASNSDSTEVAAVRMMWVDTSGQHRCRVIPSKRFEKVKDTGVGLAYAIMGMTSFGDAPAEGTNLTAIGEIRLVPDLSTKRRIPWLKQEEMVLTDMHVRPGESWEYCPRSTLKKMNKILKDEFNLVVKAGFECEFYLLKPFAKDGKEELVAFDQSCYSSTKGYDAASTFYLEVHAALDSLGIEVEQSHSAGGKGQFELVLGYVDAALAADNLIYVRETIKSIAIRHGLVATFLPRYFEHDLGSGAHAHLSVWENDKNVYMGTDTPYGMSKIGENFMAGVLSHLSAILAFIAPIPNSYERIQPHLWSGAYLCWGKENKEVPLRTCSPPGTLGELVSNFELKTFDGVANPFFGLAAIVAAGIDGLRRKLTLPPPIVTDPSELNLECLPQSLLEAVQALDKDEVLRGFFSEKLITAVRGVRMAEVDYYAKHEDGLNDLVHRY